MTQPWWVRPVPAVLMCRLPTVAHIQPSTTDSQTERNHLPTLTSWELIVLGRPVAPLDIGRPGDDVIDLVIHVSLDPDPIPRPEQERAVPLPAVVLTGQLDLLPLLISRA